MSADRAVNLTNTGSSGPKKERTMKMTMPCLKRMLVAAGALALAATCPANQLVNPGFEDGVNGWSTFNGAAAGAAPSVPVRSGNGSLVLPGFGGFGVPGAFQTFPASPGELWDFQGYLLATNTLPGGATFGVLKIVWSDGSVDLPPSTVTFGQGVFGSFPGIESRPVLDSSNSTNAWIFTRAGGIAPSGTTQVKLYVLFVDQNAGTVFCDDLQATNQPPVGPPPPIDFPTNNAPVPTVPASRVLSMYNSSGTYTDHPGINWFAPWSGPGSFFTITNPPGSVVLRKLGLTFWGVEFYAPNQIDATPYNMFHVDVWTPNANQFGIQLVSLGPTEAAQVNFPPESGKILSNQWVSLDVPLSAFTNANPNTVMSMLEQLLFLDDATVGSGVVGGNFYVDNVYFWKAATPPTLSAPAISGSNLSFTVASEADFEYVLQGTATLSPPSWQNLQTNAGTGSPIQFNVPILPANSKQFYRVIVR
jgi:hypothetical protein